MRKPMTRVAALVATGTLAVASLSLGAGSAQAATSSDCNGSRDAAKNAAKGQRVIEPSRTRTAYQAEVILRYAPGKNCVWGLMMRGGGPNVLSNLSLEELRDGAWVYISSGKTLSWGPRQSSSTYTGAFALKPQTAYRACGYDIVTKLSAPPGGGVGPRKEQAPEVSTKVCTGGIYAA